MGFERQPGAPAARWLGDLDLNLTVVCILPDQMNAHIYVFAPVMMHRILDQRNCQLVVHLQRSLAGFSP